MPDPTRNPRALVTGEAPAPPLTGWRYWADQGIDSLVSGVKGLTGLGDQGPAGPTKTNAAAILGAAIPIIGGIKKAASGIRAYHGSGADFDRFDFSHVGTGQGAQSYGHGGYFAEAEPVALDIRNQVAPKPKVMVGEREVPISPHSPDALFGHTEADQIVATRISHKVRGQREMGHQLPVKSALDAVEAELEQGIRMAVETRNEKVFNSLSDQRLALQRMREQGIDVPQTGHMYEVNLKVDPKELLDWDRRLAEQPGPVQRLGSERGWHPSVTGANVYHELSRPGLRDARTFREFTTHMDPEVASRLLTQEGVPGIRYLDQHSRARVDVPEIEAEMRRVQRQLAEWSSRADPRAPRMRLDLQRELTDLEAALAVEHSGARRTSNYVMFPGTEGLIDILRKYGLVPPIAGAAALQSLGQQRSRDQVGTPPPVQPPPRPR